MTWTFYYKLYSDHDTSKFKISSLSRKNYDYITLDFALYHSHLNDDDGVFSWKLIVVNLVCLFSLDSPWNITVLDVLI